VIKSQLGSVWLFTEFLRT